MRSTSKSPYSDEINSEIFGVSFIVAPQNQRKHSSLYLNERWWDLRKFWENILTFLEDWWKFLLVKVWKPHPKGVDWEWVICCVWWQMSSSQNLWESYKTCLKNEVRNNWPSRTHTNWHTLQYPQQQWQWHHLICLLLLIHSVSSHRLFPLRQIQYRQSIGSWIDSYLFLATLPIFATLICIAHKRLKILWPGAFWEPRICKNVWQTQLAEITVLPQAPLLVKLVTPLF